MPPLLEKFLAFARRDLLIASRYRGTLVTFPITLVTELAGAYFLARAIGAGFRPDGFDYFTFLLIGSGVTQLMVASMHAFVSSVRDAQLSGTMEMMMATATRPLTVMLLSATVLEIDRVVAFFVYVGCGFALFRAPLHAPDPAALAVVLLLASVMTISLGLLAAAIQLYFQKGGAAVWLFATAVWLLSGSMFPVSTLPAALRSVAKLLPMTYVVKMTRDVLLVKATLPDLMAPVLILTAATALLLPVSLWVFSAVLRNARLRGTLSMY
ncbi:MAG: ABC transporter permease [Acidobacteriia bacterium]|nr:ABC transporter permease [Terriglobia bacterium]